ncbi:MAG: hypothetical protein APZ16_04455 [Candidatus Hadarchaeum yellowstonense]|uniref:PKD domain-containing protein n=1 Tax=Hadarchaeum yellowstonense TaxID=1776334 RepID=A0A147JW31_HADYE|nr:MAG: hypothetical protein APZ16_04455 [Candidatus Hadarchaeum yellowstonense]
MREGGKELRKAERIFAAGLAILVVASALATFQTPSASAQGPAKTPTPSVVSTITGAPIKFAETGSYVSLDFTMFRIEFYKGTAGYNTIYASDNSVLVYNERIVLEYLSKAPDTWKQRGTPTGIGWQKIDDYHWKVWRNYDDYNGTTYKVVYDVRSDSNVKITIELTNGQTDNYRIAWYVSGITKTQQATEKTRMVFGDGTTTIGLDWSDVWQSFGDIATSAVEDTAQGKKASICFNVGAVQAGQRVVIDPSLVGTSTTAYATLYPPQRKSFYANGRFWVFYSNGTNMVYHTSTDGSTWSIENSIRISNNGYLFSVWFDGNYLHYTYASNSAIYYRRGTPNSDGTITWSASEQTVSTTYNYANRPIVSVDSNGYVWVGYYDYDGTNYCPYVIRSGNNDGTWGTTPGGFPYRLSTTSSSSWRVIVVPLTSGKVLTLYGASEKVRARRWDGSTWGSEVATTSSIYYGSYSAVAQGDDVHLVFLKSSSYDIMYTKYSYSSNSFSTETTLVSRATLSSAPVMSIDPATNDLYVFAATKTTESPSGWTANHIYCIKYTASSGTWGSWTDWIDESTENLTGSDRLTCFYQAYSNYIGLVYMTKTASPYNVKFDFLDVTPPPNVAPNPPTSLQVEGQTNPTRLTTFTPKFSAVFSDNDSGDKGTYIHIKVGTSPGDNNMWDSGWIDIADTDNNTRSENITYAGSALSRGVTYYWRARFKDTAGAEGAWSTETATFRLNQPPTAPDVVIIPAAPRTADNLTAVAENSTDPDGDTVTYFYQWYKNGAPQVGENDNLITSDLTAKWENWMVVVTPFDGYENGPSENTSVVILNTPPTAPASLILNIPKVNENITAAASGSTDVDGDTITYYYEFYNYTDAAKRKAYSTDNFYTVAVSDAHDNIAVRVLAFDGYENSSVFENSIVVANTPPTVTIAQPTFFSFNTLQNITFQASGSDADNDNLTFSWNFGDGTPAETGVTVIHRYLVGGAYIATVTASDGTDTAQASVTLYIGGGGGGGYVAPENLENIPGVSPNAPPVQNLLMWPLFSAFGIVFSLWMMLAAIAIIAYLTDQKGIVIATVLMFAFLLVFGAKLVQFIMP